MPDDVFQPLLAKQIEMMQQQLAKELEAPFWGGYDRLAGPRAPRPPLAPLQGPPTPDFDRTDLYVRLEDGYLAVNSGGYESETVMLDRSDVEALIEFLQLWKDIVHDDS